MSDDDGEPIPDAHELLRVMDAHYAAIGRVAEAWASTELIIDGACWKLAGVEDLAGAALTSQVLGMQRKLDALISLAKLRGAGRVLLGQIHAFANKSRGLQEARNRVVHDPWLLMDGPPRRFEVSGRRVAKMELVAMPTDVVLSLAAKIDALYDEAQEITTGAQAIAPPLPGTVR